MILTIGYGNPLRRDDGAGPELARRLARRWESQGRSVKLIVEHQLLPELAPELADPSVDIVVFIDADAKADAPRVRQISADEGASPGTGHHLTPQALMALAMVFSDLLPRAWLVSLPARDFAHGEGLGPIAAAAIDYCEDMMLCFPERVGNAPSCLLE